MPTRQIYWNISGHSWLYLLLLPFMVVLAYGLVLRYRSIKHGSGFHMDHPWRRVGRSLSGSLVQRRLWIDPAAGLLHAGIMWGMVVLTFGTVMVLLKADLGLPVFQGTFYLWLSLAMDLFGLGAAAGLTAALVRRYAVRPARLDNRWEDAVVLIGLLFIVVVGFALEALRLAATDDPWQAWSPVGAAIAVPLRSFPSTTLLGLHVALWWVHLGSALAIIALLPFTKLIHLMTAPAQHLLRNLTPQGTLQPIDFSDETREIYGVASLDQVETPVRLSLEACTRCGRCQEECPAHLSGKPLNPKQVVGDVREMLEAGLLLQFRATSSAGGEGGAGAHAASSTVGAEIDLGADVIWSCTTCRACETRCPVFIEQSSLLIEMRQHAVMVRSDLPVEGQLALRNIETNFNPWGFGWASRADWRDGLGVPDFSEAAREDPGAWLFWVGCSASFDARNRKVAESLTKLLRHAGVPFGILGTTEHCCGDPARRLGNEYLFQTLAQHNVAAMKDAGVHRIVTACPHCHHVLAQEYGAFGGNFEVVHHSTLLNALVEDRKLVPVNGRTERITYHDSCYLGRYAGVYEAPRRVIDAIPGLSRVELKRSRDHSFCCGGGGGRAFLEETLGKRINLLRSEEVVAQGAPLLATACPFCMTMLQDGAKEFGEAFEVLDIAEVLASAVVS